MLRAEQAQGLVRRPGLADQRFQLRGGGFHGELAVVLPIWGNPRKPGPFADLLADLAGLGHLSQGVGEDKTDSYDDNEPNDNAFKATQLNLSSTEPYSASTSASLNVVNDQDWYVISIRWKGPYEIKVGNYSVNISFRQSSHKKDASCSASSFLSL